MRRKRVLQVRWLKVPIQDEALSEGPVTLLGEPSPGLVDNVGKTIDRSIRNAGMVVVGYVLLDTVRQVLVAKATNS